MERLSLTNSAFEGDNNAYLFIGSEVGLIDTGDWTSTSREQLQAALAEHDLTFADVDRILLTHWHGDHTGLAGEIQAQGGADVLVHERDAPLVEGDEEAWRQFHDLQKQYFEDWRMPRHKRDSLEEYLAGVDTIRNPPDVTAFEDGAEIAVGGHELKAVHAPGHAAGLCLFEAHVDGSVDVFSGDALLPVYTPNVGGTDVRVEDPLEKYIRVLRGIVDADYDRAWPGHREPISDPGRRAATIIEHHEERAWRVLQTLAREGPCDTWTTSAELFGELDGIHILHGPGESSAHLEHLRKRSVVVREGVEYRLADGMREELERLEADRWPLID